MKWRVNITKWSSFLQQRPFICYKLNVGNRRSIYRYVAATEWCFELQCVENIFYMQVKNEMSVVWAHSVTLKKQKCSDLCVQRSQFVCFVVPFQIVPTRETVSPYMSLCIKPVQPVKINTKYMIVQLKHKVLYLSFLNPFYQVTVIYCLMNSCAETRFVQCCVIFKHSVEL